MGDFSNQDQESDGNNEPVESNQVGQDSFGGDDVVTESTNSFESSEPLSSSVDESASENSEAESSINQDIPSFTDKNSDTLEDSSTVSEPMLGGDSYEEDSSDEVKVIDGFDEATSSLRDEVRETTQLPNKDNSSLGKIIGAGAVALLLLFGGVKMCSRPAPVIDDTMLLIVNQTVVSPEKITVYLKSVYGVSEPVIKVKGVLKEKFSATTVDEKNNVVTWFWTVEGKRAQKAFNKNAVIKLKMGKDKYYEEEFTLDKEIRIDYAG